jgi:MFS transporter, BCD family, chlorophyll transporter
MSLSWFGIFRLGLVQLCLGSIVVLMTSTLNRLMIVELALPAVLPGLLVALHYGIQITRPNWGFLSDTGGHRTRWIIGGMAVLALGAYLAALSIPVLEHRFLAGLALAMVAYALIGLGVGASGTSLLALLATTTAPRHRPAAATITWLMMIFGIAMTATVVGQFLDPYSHARMLEIVAIVTGAALALTCLAVWGIERGLIARPQPDPMPYRQGIAEIWHEPAARRFTVFVFLSMTAYFMQELILEPFAGLVFAFTPGQTTSMSGAQNGGVFLGMLAVGILATGFRLGSLRAWVVGGCLGSGGALATIAAIGIAGPATALVPAVMALGFFNGMFAVAAIGSMMALAGQGRQGREGTRMGLWGAAQAIAAGFGGLAGAALVDVMRRSLASDASAFGTVFLIEAALFLAAAAMAMRVMERRDTAARAAMIAGE